MDARPRICFVTYELHPTTWGGCGVLLHHAAERLLRDGHEVVFLLDFDASLVQRFRDVDRRALPAPERCSAHSVEELCADFPWSTAEIGCPFQYKALRFGWAVQQLLERESIDFVEFFEYCGVGYYAFARRLYDRIAGEAVLGSRLHNSIELIDMHEATKVLDVDRYLLYALERAALGFTEVALTPTHTYAEAYYQREYGLDPARTVVSQSPRSPFPRVDRAPPDERDEIVYFGRVYQFKGVDRLVQAALQWMDEEPDFAGRFVFIGPDSRESPEGRSHVAYLRSLIPPRHADRFDFPGSLDHEAAARRMARARLAAFPNTFESFCYALHEVYESGIPVIVADLPGFRDFFQDGRHCLVFDGGVEDLVAKMRRLWHDPELAERLSRPEEVAVEPLGDWYRHPRALAPLAEEPGAEVPEVLAVVLGPDGAAWRRTRDALAAQQGGGPSECLRLEPIEGAADGGLPFLGRRWRPFDAAGAPRRPAELRSRGAIWILEAGDVAGPEYLSLARKAFGRRRRMAFAGTWTRHEGIVQPTTLDVAPEIHPFQFGPQRLRVVLRTREGHPLVDLFDDRLGSYGEIGALWDAVDEHGPGCLLPETHLDVQDAAPRPPDPRRLSFLVMNQRQPERLRALARFATVVRQDMTAEMPSARKMKRLALRSLGAGTLFKLAFRRLLSARRG